MSWSYSADPASSTLDQVRWLAGQTSTGDDVLVEDEEILWAVGQEPNVYYAAATVAETLATRYAGRVLSKKVGDLAISYGSRSKEYTARAKELRKKGSMRGSVAYAGGLTAGDMSQQRSGMVPGAFAMGMHDNPESLVADTLTEST